MSSNTANTSTNTTAANTTANWKNTIVTSDADANSQTTTNARFSEDVIGPNPNLRGGDEGPSVGDAVFCFCCLPCFNLANMGDCSARNAVCCLCCDLCMGIELLFKFNIGETLTGNKI